MNPTVGVWTLTVCSLSRADLGAAYGWCDSDEQDRSARFAFEADRVAFLASHGLLRMALSKFDRSRDPQQWNLSYTPTGRPVVGGSGEYPDLRVSISHSRTMVACAIGDGVDCGVDVEPLDRIRDVSALARRVLTETEQRWIAEAKDSASKSARFLELWTLKEALTKAVGLGMAIDFDGIEFGDLNGSPHLIRCAAELDRKWRLTRHIEDNHVIAAAVDATRSPIVAHHRMVRWREPRPAFIPAGRASPIDRRCR